MRVGFSWDVDASLGSAEAWQPVLAEIQEVDRFGYDSVWMVETRDSDVSCTSPTLFMTYVAKCTSNVLLRASARRVTSASPVRLAEEVAVLDSFSRGRAGIGFASASRQGVAPGHVHEVIDFMDCAWAVDDFRYRGEFVRFPTHTGDDAPLGMSEPDGKQAYVPQWERGPAMPDYLAITPKPLAVRPPIYVEIDDDETLEWAARRGIAPFVAADMPTDEAVERLSRYRKLADAAGRSRSEVDAVLERRVHLDGKADASALGGSPPALLAAIRELRGETSISHFVWRRQGSSPGDLFRFAGEVQMMLQA